MKKHLLLLLALTAPSLAYSQTQTQYYTVPSIAALKAMTTSRPQVVQVNDATPGIFNLTSGACSAADDIYQVQPTSGTTVCYTRLATSYFVGDSPTFTGTVTSGATTVLKSIVETVSAVSITTNVLTINLGSGATVYTTTSNANITTFTISNVPAGATAFTLYITGDGTGWAQNWGTVLWALSTPPILTSTNGKIDVLTFTTNDGGTTWFGFIGGQNF